jgi:mannose/cellobiose epimerase-like protein (N-acyl-D-glucosamine 2-epimerase family)
VLDQLGVPDDAWLAAEADRLARGVAAARRPEGGFGWLDDSLQLVADSPAETWITARMTHVAGLEVLRGNDFGDLLDHGVVALEGLLVDHEHGGWFSTTDPAGQGEKKAYDHSFVVLAGATAAVAGHPRGRALLDRALDRLETSFWDDERGLLVDVWDRSWQQLEPYRGANANMHGVEAMLAAADATGDDLWQTRALRVAETLVHKHAREHQWRLPEHFDERWQVLPEYNKDDPAHPFRPYGATVGHWLEWSRLLLHLRHGLTEPPAWLLDDSRSLFDAAVAEGWSVDGAPGFVYTVDADGAPVVRARLHWVVCEAIAAAAAWRAEQPSADTDGWLATWWAYAREYLIDIRGGSWRHELGADNVPASGGTWTGKPDVYHAYQAALIGLLPPARSLAGALVDR